MHSKKIGEFKLSAELIDQQIAYHRNQHGSSEYSLASFASLLGESGRIDKALAIAGSLDNANAQAQIYQGVTEGYIKAGRVSEVASFTKELQNDEALGEVARGLAQHGHTSAALETVKLIQDKSSAGRTLRMIATIVSPVQKDEAVGLLEQAIRPAIEAEDFAALTDIALTLSRINIDTSRTRSLLSSIVQSTHPLSGIWQAADRGATADNVVANGAAGSSLTRQRAKQLILNASQYPKEILSPIALGEFRTGSALAQLYRKYAKQLNASGLGVATSKGDLDYQLTMKIELTEKGEKFARTQGQKVSVVKYTGVLGDVTGIAFLNEQQSMARVEYTEIFEPTPFAALDSPLDGQKMAKRVDKTAHFQLFDDGWRIKR